MKLEKVRIFPQHELCHTISFMLIYFYPISHPRCGKRQMAVVKINPLDWRRLNLLVKGTVTLPQLQNRRIKNYGGQSALKATTQYVITVVE